MRQRKGLAGERLYRSNKCGVLGPNVVQGGWRMLNDREAVCDKIRQMDRSQIILSLEFKLSQIH